MFGMLLYYFIVVCIISQTLISRQGGNGELFCPGISPRSCRLTLGVPGAPPTTSIVSRTFFCLLGDSADWGSKMGPDGGVTLVEADPGSGAGVEGADGGREGGSVLMTIPPIGVPKGSISKGWKRGIVKLVDTRQECLMCFRTVSLNLRLLALFHNVIVVLWLS